MIQSKQIIILHPHFLKPAGASKVVLEFAERLSKFGLDITIVTTQVNDKVLEDYHNIKINSLGGLTTGSLWFWIFFPFFYFKLKKALKNYENPILFCHSLSIYWGAFYKIFNPQSRLVYYFHDLGFPYTDSNEEIKGLSFLSSMIAKLVLPIFKNINQSAIKKANYLISNSKTSADFIHNKYHKKVDLIISPGVDSNIFKPSNLKEKYFYTLGRLEKIKEIDLIINSFAYYCFKYNDTITLLKIIGSGREENCLKKLSEKLKISKRVIFLGNRGQNEVAKVAAHAKAGIFLRSNEPFGLAALETLSCGTPVIGVNQGGISEMVIDGQNGFTTSLDPKDVAEKIHNLIAGDYKSYCKKAEETAARNYSWDISAQKLEEFFNKI